MTHEMLALSLGLAAMLAAADIAHGAPQCDSREAVTARQAAMYLVRRMTNLSTPDIGREFGGRDHTTVLHALEQVETKLQNDPGFAQTIKDITININSKR